MTEAANHQQDKRSTCHMLLFYFCLKTYVVGTHQKRHNETLPISTTANVFT